MKQNTIAKLTKEAIEYNTGDEKRISHLLNVYSYAKTIGILEDISKKDLFILESAAILHDIGIKVCEQKYGNCGGKLQEKEGPKVAEKILKKLEYEVDDIDRILFLIAHHHTYDKIDKIDYQILIEADFIVNLIEENYTEVVMKNIYNKHFKTKTGKELFCNTFNLKK